MENINFPKTTGKHEFEPLFKAEHMLSKMEESIGSIGYQKAVLIYSNSLFRYFKALYRMKRSKLNRWLINSNSIYEFGDHRILAYLGIGAPLTATTTEELIVAGVKEFLILGTAGGLGPHLRIGDFVLCTKALRDEGVSHHYIANSRYVKPDSELTDRIAKLLKKNKISFRSGATWTIDAPYAETIEEVKRYSKEGIITVEMEAAALFAVAKKRGVKAAALFNISDILRIEGWSGFSKGKTRQKKCYPILAGLANLW